MSSLRSLAEAFEREIADEEKRMVMSSAAYIAGLIAGAKAARGGPDACRRALDRYWLQFSGYVLLPGQTEIRRRTLQEWQEETDPLVQEMTGHNRLEYETPEIRRAQMHLETTE